MAKGQGRGQSAPSGLRFEQLKGYKNREQRDDANKTYRIPVSCRVMKSNDAFIAKELFYKEDYQGASSAKKVTTDDAGFLSFIFEGIMEDSAKEINLEIFSRDVSGVGNLTITIPALTPQTQPASTPAQPQTAGQTAQPATAQQQANGRVKCKRHCCNEQLPQGTAECPICGWDQIKDEPPSFLWRLRRDRPEDVRMAGMVLAGAGALFLVALIHFFGWHWSYGLILAAISLGSYILLSKELKTEVIIAVVVIIAIVGGIMMLTPESWMKKEDQQQQTISQTPEQQLQAALMHYTNLWGPPMKVVRLEGEEWKEICVVRENDRIHYLSSEYFLRKDDDHTKVWEPWLNDMQIGKGNRFYGVKPEGEKLYFHKYEKPTMVYVWIEREGKIN